MTNHKMNMYERFDGHGRYVLLKIESNFQSEDIIRLHQIKDFHSNAVFDYFANPGTKTLPPFKFWN